MTEEWSAGTKRRPGRSRKPLISCVGSLGSSLPRRILPREDRVRRFPSSSSVFGRSAGWSKGEVRPKAFRPRRHLLPAVE